MSHLLLLFNYLFHFCFSFTFAAKSSECTNKAWGEIQRGAALEQRSGNAPKQGASLVNGKGTGFQMQSRGNKRKQLDQHGGSENEPPEKKQTTRTSVKMPGKNGSKALSKKKLIAGQGKLTSFFRV